jgi:hypothetical protein
MKESGYYYGLAATVRNRTDKSHYNKPAVNVVLSCSEYE